jgi:tRNA (cmo5U34)-methyltransferase
MFRDRLTTRQFDLGGDDWRQMPERPQIVVSSLAVHHLHGAGKRKLFGDLHALLAPGGAFVLADIMRPTSAAGFAVAAEAYERAVAERSLRERGDLSMLAKLRELKWNYFRHPDDDPIDQPSTVAEHLRWLEGSGFRGVDVFWAVAGHAIVGGMK